MSSITYVTWLILGSRATEDGKPVTKGYLKWAIGPERDDRKYLVTTKSVKKEVIHRIVWHEGKDGEDVHGSKETENLCMEHLQNFVRHYGVHAQWKADRSFEMTRRVFDALTKVYGSPVLKIGLGKHTWN